MRTGIILAGGKGARMGAFKPLLPWRGRPLVAYAIDALAPLCDEVLVMAGPHAAKLSRVAAGARVYADPGEGPPVALRLAAQLARHPTLLVAPADAPRLTPAVYARLLEAGGSAIFVVDGVPDPTVAVYARDEVRAFRGRSLQELAAARVEPGALAALLADADTPEDLKRLDE